MHNQLMLSNSSALAVSLTPPLKQTEGSCPRLFLLAQGGGICFTELAERGEYGNSMATTSISVSISLSLSLYIYIIYI